uniref:Uncharacterized protein n=1 Tax=Chenopodium quinoa TaxID=63459 RepID=A0A803LGP7_CHEQI
MIVSCLKKRLQFDDSAPDGGPHKRRKENENATVEIVNRNGVVVDLAALEERENDGGPFAEELRKMAEGRVKQEELLEVLGAIEGDWCSRRKKRRVVDASLLGDALPVGWKIIVALRRKGGQFFPYCRRYLSPTGEQLSSCKEVSSYLQSYFGINDAKLVRDIRGESQQLQIVDSVNHMCMISEDGNSMMDLSNSPLHSVCLPTEHETDALLLGIENLPDVRICDLYECRSCNVSFDERDKYKQHMFTLHRKTTKRYSVDIHLEDKVVKDGKTECQHLDNKVIVKDGKTNCQHVDDKVIVKDAKSDCKKKRRRKLGLSVSDGVIMKDGKYGCQFCTKVFEERRRYLGHVGNHVKGSIETPKDLLIHLNGHARAPCMESLPSGISNPGVDALVEITQSSNQPNNSPVFVKEHSGVNNVDQFIVAYNMQQTDQMSKSNSCQDEVTMGKHCSKGKSFTGELYRRCKMVSGKSSACPNDTLRGNGSEEGKLSSKELHPSCNRVREMSVTDANANHLDSSIGDHEGEDIGEDKILSLENPQGKTGEIPRADVDINVPATCPDEREIEKAVKKDETLSMKINPLAKMNKISIVDGEIKRQPFIRNIVSSEKNSCFETTMTPAAESGIAEKVSCNGRCNNTAADDEDLLNIHPLWCNEKSSDYDSSGKKTQLGVHMTEPKHAQNYDSDLVTISGKNHESNCTVPQVPANSSSTFDEIFEKAGQDICSLDQNLESVHGLEYLKLDVIEPQMYKYNDMSREDSISFYDVSMDLGNNIGIGLGLGLDDPLKSQSEFPQELARSCLTTTVCVWCGVEFSHEVTDIEPQPDSVGFMCPSCRAKISKQFNDLENNFSLSPQLTDRPLV